MLLDINLWLALVFERHFHHRAAKSWFDSVSIGTCFFCRMTQQGFLRLATNPRVMNEEAVSLPDAWGLYDTLLGDEHVGYAEEPAGLEPRWRQYTLAPTYSPKVWNDAYLAAFARAASLSVVTFDQGFSRYPNLDPILLSTPGA